MHTLRELFCYFNHLHIWLYGSFNCASYLFVFFLVFFALWLIRYSINNIYLVHYSYVVSPSLDTSVPLMVS